MEESLCWFTFWYKLLICRGLGIVVPWQAQLLGHTLSHPQWMALSETYRARIWRCMCMRFWKLLVGSTFSSALLHELSGKSYKKKIFGSLLTSHIWVLSLKMSCKQSHMREWCLKIKKNFTYMHFFWNFQNDVSFLLHIWGKLGLVRLRTCPKPHRLVNCTVRTYSPLSSAHFQLISFMIFFPVSLGTGESHYSSHWMGMFRRKLQIWLHNGSHKILI